MVRDALSWLMNFLAGPADTEAGWVRHNNTFLFPWERPGYEKWLAEQSQKQGRNVGLDLPYYDVQGFYQSGMGTDERGHGTDRFKKPWHPTFSNESKYARGREDAGVWTRHPTQGVFFVPGKMNVETHGLDFLRNYFKRGQQRGDEEQLFETIGY